MNLFPLKLWSHVYRKQFHAEVDTDNLTEAFNHALRCRYLHLQQDKTVSAFVRVVIDIVFSEHEREYIIATTQQRYTYRIPRYPLPAYLKNRPHSVQAACLLNIEKAKDIKIEDISEIQSGEYKVCATTAHSKDYTVNILEG